MSKSEPRPDNLGKPKVPTFASVLRTAIHEEFGSSKAFSIAIGLSPGRVSQIINGSESITAQTLEQVIEPFSESRHREAIHDAWISTYAPRPDSHLIRGQDVRESAVKLLSSMPELIARGQARKALSEIQLTKVKIKDNKLGFQLDRAQIELCLLLNRTSDAMTTAQSLTEKAREAHEPTWIARGLWLKAIAGRNSPSTSVQQMIRLHEDSAQFLASWNPTGDQAKADLLDMRQAVSRDRLLTLLAVAQRKPIKSELLESEIQMLGSFLECDLAPNTEAVFLEVKGRGQLVLGDVFGAEESIAKSSISKKEVSHNHDIRVRLLKAQFLLARGEKDQGRNILQQTLESCFEIDDLHHAAVIDRLLGTLTL